MESRTRAVTIAATRLLVTLLVVSQVMADEVVDPEHCLKAVHLKGKAELIITAADGKFTKLRKVLADAKLDCVAQLQVDGACLVQVDPWQGQTIEAIADRLSSNIYAIKGAPVAPKEVQDVVAKVIVNLDFDDSSVSPIPARRVYPKKKTSEDPLLSEQIELAELRAETAWFDAPKDSDVLTAIIDTGVKVDHQDLDGQFQTGITIGCFTQNCDGTPIEIDPKKHHGTRVAGILGAKKGNAFGGAGVAWNTEFISINYGIFFSQFRVSCALQQAIERKAPIVNASWAGRKEAEQLLLRWDLFEKYVVLAQNEGMLLVFAAGNESVDLDDKVRYPAELGLPNMLVVMGYTVGEEELPPETNYGKETTHIAAPDYATVTTCIESEDCYITTEESGTSWSAAYVSGAAALLKSRYPGTDFDFLKWRITENATPDERLKYKNQTGGRLNLVGTIFPVTAAQGAVSRSRDSPISWATGIRDNMCAEVSIEGRPVNGNFPGEYFSIVGSTPNDGTHDIPHGRIAHVKEHMLQVRVQCLNKAPAAESLPLPLN